MRPVGATQPIPIDVRVISATHRDLDAHKASGQFREDLYYRLNVVSLKLPALADRREDIPLLADALPAPPRRALQARGARAGAGCDGTPRRRAVAGQRPPAPQPARAGGGARDDQRDPGLAGPERAAARTRAALVPFEEARKTFERDYLVRLLKITGGNVTQAAQLAKRNRTEFYKLLQRHRLEPAMFKEGKSV